MGNNCGLPSFIEKIDLYKDNSIILFNKINGTIMTVLDNEFKLIEEGNVNKLDEDIIENLSHCQMLDNKCFEQLKFYNESDFFHICIEMSTICNLNCTYCYQSNDNKRNEISDNIIENILIYIKNVFSNNSIIKTLSISFIGGEPLLHKNKLIKIYTLIKDICDEYEIKLSTHIDTNGTIALNDIYEKIDNLGISVTLSSEEDHNTNRGDFKTIVYNLKKIKQKEGNSVRIRYNTSEKNINEFDLFVKYVKMELPICSFIGPMYADNYSYNEFINLLDKDYFKIWNSTIALKCLLDNNFPISFSINSGLKLCYGYQPYSCKIYSNGAVTLCDSMYCDMSKITIEQLSEDPNLLNSIYPEYKNYNPLLDDKCKSCDDVVLCGGNILCREQCDYESIYNINHFVKTYVESYIEDKADLFINM